MSPETPSLTVTICMLKYRTTGRSSLHYGITDNTFDQLTQRYLPSTFVKASALDESDEMLDYINLQAQQHHMDCYQVQCFMMCPKQLRSSWGTLFRCLPQNRASFNSSWKQMERDGEDTLCALYETTNICKAIIFTNTTRDTNCILRGYKHDTSLLLASIWPKWTKYDHKKVPFWLSQSTDLLARATYVFFYYGFPIISVNHP